MDLSAAESGEFPTPVDFAICILVFGGQFAGTDDYYSVLTAIYGGLNAALLGFMILRYVKVRPSRLPWIELILADTYVQFGLPMFMRPVPIGVAGVLPRVDSFEYASLLALICSLAALSSFAVVRLAARPFSAGALLPDLTPAILARAAPIHLAISVSYILMYEALPSTRAVLLPVANIVQTFFYHTPLVVVAMATYLSMPRPLHLAQVFVAFGTLGYVAAATSMLSTLLVPIVGVAPLWWRARERVPVFLVALTIAAVAVLQPAKSYFRSIRQNDQSADVISAWGRALSESYDATQASHLQRLTGGQDTMARLSELGTLAYTVEVVPESVPETGGISYRMLVTSLIPRVFWPDKPNMTEYALNPFVLALHLTTPEGTEYSVTGISLLSQGYLEHGFIGSFGWMLLFGALTGFIAQYFGTTFAGVVAGAIVLGPLATAEGGMQSRFGSTPQQVFGATLLVWVLWFIGGGMQQQRLARAPLSAAQPFQSLRGHSSK